MKTAAKIIAFMLKLFAIVFLIKLGLSRYDSSASLLSQHILVWICLYLPLAVGIESLIAIVAAEFMKKVAS